MNVLHAGSEVGRRVCGAWWLFVSQQAEGALRGNPVPGSCAADVCGLKLPLCCNVILLFIRQAGSRSTHKFGLLGPFSRGEMPL